MTEEAENLPLSREAQETDDKDLRAQVSRLQSEVDKLKAEREADLALIDEVNVDADEEEGEPWDE